MTFRSRLRVPLQLLPLLVSSLDLPDLTLRANVIDTLSVLVKEVPMEMDASISSMALKVLRGVVGEAANSKSRGAVVSRRHVIDSARAVC